MKFTTEYNVISEIGKRTDINGLPHQEDTIVPDAETVANCRVFVLCDGMGGHKAGEVASREVGLTMSDQLKSFVQNEEDALADVDVETAVDACFDSLDRIDTSEDSDKKMGTTMVSLALHRKGATISHVGDSRLYHIRPGEDQTETRILFKTKDHSLVNDLIAIGEISEEQARGHSQRNVLSRAVMPHEVYRAKADIKHVDDIRPGDYFYLCSDGMLEQMDDDDLRRIFSIGVGNIEDRKALLVKETAENNDNHSAILVHILSVEGLPPSIIRKRAIGASIASAILLTLIILLLFIM